MDEQWYRASQLCRILGNPTAFQILLLLQREGPLTPGDMARRVGRKVSTISMALGKMRGIELVRYDTRGGRTRYWLKQPRESRALLAGLSRVVHSASSMRGRR